MYPTWCQKKKKYQKKIIKNPQKHKKSKNCQKWFKIQKSEFFFEKSEKITFFLFFIFILFFLFRWKKEKENSITLVLPIEEISLWPELSSPARFRIQVGYRERDIQMDERTNGQTNEGNPRVQFRILI